MKRTAQIAAMVAMFASMNVLAELTGDAATACEAVLCLSTASPPNECANALGRYFSISFKHWSDTVKARRNFLKLCPEGDSVNVNPGGGDQGAPESITVTEYRVLTCAQAEQDVNGYGIYINPPSEQAKAVPDGWVLERMGIIGGIAEGGWANSPFYADGKLIGYGYALEHHDVTKDKATGEILTDYPWATSKTADCTLSNPEVYGPR